MAGQPDHGEDGATGPGAGTGVDLATRIERSAAPAAVRAAVERIGEERPEDGTRLHDDPALAAATVAVAGASRWAIRLLEADPVALHVLGRLDEPVADDAVTDADALVRWRDLEQLRIAARDLLDLDDLPATGRALTHLGERLLGHAARLAGADDLVVVAMGKLGAAELNYASDLDVVFVGEGGYDALERQARELLAVAGRAVRVDTNLRPEGRDGPLVRTLASFEAYWDRWAQPWEFQALLKARPVTGPDELGDAFAAAAGRRTWERAWGADELRELRSMKARAEAEVARQGLTDREVKRGRGGIRDVEFAVQLLQLVHGGADPALRVPATLDALEALADGGYIARTDADALAEAYTLLRRVEHALQLVDDQQVHTVPADEGARRRLARVLGFRTTPADDEVAAFDAALARRQATVRGIHERLWFRPLLEAYGAQEGTALGPDALAARLAAFGFRDADRTRAAVLELTRGLSRQSRLMQQALPLLLDWLSDAPDPDLGLLGLRKLAEGARAQHLAATIRESADAARALCRVLGTSRELADVLVHEPDLLGRLGDPDQLRTLPRDELVDRAAKATSWRSDPAERQEALRRWRRRNLVGVAGRDLLGEASVVEVGHDLTQLAEATLEAGLRSLEPRLGFAIVALGRLGGGELSYASDLDVVFVYEDGSPGAFEEAERTAEAFLRTVSGTTPAARIYAVDPDLRPEGRDGPLARSVEGFGTYFDRWAQTWERQAMTRARPVAGDLDLGRAVLERIEDRVWAPLTPEDEREIRRMKARVERERIPAGEDPEFHLKLGRGSLSDVEWTAQLLQLRHGLRGTGTIATLDGLAERGVVDDDDHAVLVEAYRFCERARNRLALVGGNADALPAKPERLTVLARSLGTTGATLRDDYRRVTRRCRHVVERLFYDLD